MNIKYIAAIVSVFIIGVFGYFVFAHKEQSTQSDKMSVVASFYPMYFFAQEIGGEKAEVKNITPAGAEPHEYEPTPQDLVAIQNSDLLVLNGAGLEPWSTDVLASIPAEKVVIAGETFATLEGEEHEEHEEEADHEGEEEHITDPHVWLSPELAIKIVDRIEQGFAKADPTNASYYADNAASLKSRISALDTEYKQGLARCSSKDIVTSHAAFGYLAAEYGLHQVSIAGLSPEEEPSAQELAEVADFAKKNKVKYIFFESLISPKLSQTIATEVGAQTLVLDPIEGIAADDLAAGQDYLTVMRSNLANLKVALQCTQ